MKDELKDPQDLKFKIFKALVDNGEIPDTIDRDLVIIISGIKVTKKKIRGITTFTVEDTSTLDNYYNINNKFILNSILGAILKIEKNDNRSNKIKRPARLCKSMEKQ